VLILYGREGTLVRHRISWRCRRQPDQRCSTAREPP